MDSKSLINVLLSVSVFLLVSLVLVSNGQDPACKCNARFVGEYCGSDLAGNCSRELIYFCGKSNLRGKTAIALRSCTEKGYECSSKANKGDSSDTLEMGLTEMPIYWADVCQKKFQTSNFEVTSWWFKTPLNKKIFKKFWYWPPIKEANPPKKYLPTLLPKKFQNWFPPQ